MCFDGYFLGNVYINPSSTLKFLVLNRQLEIFNSTSTLIIMENIILKSDFPTETTEPE